MQEPIKIRVKTPKLHTRSKFPITIGIPFGAGEINSDQLFEVGTPDDARSIPAQTKPLSHWPDGSVRWLQTRFIAEVNEEQTEADFELIASHKQSPKPNTIKVQENPTELRVVTPSSTLVYTHNKLGWHQHNTQSENDANFYEVNFELRDVQGTNFTSALNGNWTLTESGPVCIQLNCRGEWLDSAGNPFANFNCTVEIFPQTETLKVDFGIHNPRRARHPGGLWDLGDPGSIHFRKLAVKISSAEQGTVWLESEPGRSRLSGQTSLLLYQDSSGGENWNSSNHIDANGELTVSFRGYKLWKEDKLTTEGLRASPIAGLIKENGNINVACNRFWENFPSALKVAPNGIEIGLFPSETAKPYELQGGERKSQTFYLNHGSDTDALEWTRKPPVPVLDPIVYEQSHAFPWFKANTLPQPLDQLIRQGIDGPSNFFSKREVIDEYGWRNFGDLFADHESLYRKEDEPPFISHYNNQYDPIYGFARQFALTGDQRWFELMDDLAHHVMDIDIYHTDDDRCEYNHGLFWHTDHYLDACTATHRTFSSHNNTSSTPGQTGGGPAAEHCYTSGLLYHYWLTGHSQSRKAVLDLAKWMVDSHEGQGGLLEQLLALKKHEVPALKALIHGNKPLAHRYPFTRATGNYLNALIDAWSLTGDSHWKKKAETVIQASIHPEDNPDERNLLVVETGWSYLILLMSIEKYLFLKAVVGEEDEDYTYALNALRRYTRWMLMHERPFLSDIKELEFPNDTWIAQDIRKSALMYQAAHYDRLQSQNYQEKAVNLLQYINEKLENSNEAHFTRILVILMQNHGPQYFLKSDYNAKEIEYIGYLPSPFLSWRQLISRIASRLIKGILTFRPARERAWLKARLDRS